MLVKRKVFCTNNANNYANWLDCEVELVTKPEDADIIIFTGGEDVDPSLYNCKKHHRTYSDIIRDRIEKKIFDNMRKDQLAIGICRGSQLLCVLNGGKLIQDVTCHAIGTTHKIYDLINDTIYSITSTHHQMQYPFDIENYKILCGANSLSYIYEGDGIDDSKITTEPEVVLYNNSDKPVCLAIQGHPEYMRKDAPVLKYLNDLVTKLLNKENVY